MNITKVLLIIFMAQVYTPAFAIMGEVIIGAGADPLFRQQISANLSEVINSFEDGNLTSQRTLFTEEGFRSIKQLLEATGMRNARRTHRTNLVNLDRGGWEVRDIKVKVKLGETANNEVQAATDPTEYLVFDLTPKGLIDNVNFSVARGHVKKLIDDGKRLGDSARRLKILQTVEIFRTAYCRKDLDYLNRIFSDDALIIVGRVLKPREDIPDMLQSSGLGKERIQFVRRTKAEYLAGLEVVFKRNAFVKVVFDSLDVLQHGDDPDLYGVSLKQNWYSSTYSDTGWVFLLWDFKDDHNPTIYVRSWQPEKFEDDSIIGLYDFKIERGKAQN